MCCSPYLLSINGCKVAFIKSDRVSSCPNIDTQIPDKMLIAVRNDRNQPHRLRWDVGERHIAVGAELDHPQVNVACTRTSAFLPYHRNNASSRFPFARSAMRHPRIHFTMCGKGFTPRNNAFRSSNAISHVCSKGKPM